MSRTSITYRLPGGMSCTYSGEPQSYLAWLRGTWIGGYGLWSMWLRVAAHMALNGQMPIPTLVTAEVIRVFRRFVWEAKTHG